MIVINKINNKTALAMVTYINKQQQQQAHYLLYLDFTPGAPENRIGAHRKVCLLSRLSDFQVIFLQSKTKYNLFECQWGLVLSQLSRRVGRARDCSENASIRSVSR